MTLALSDSGNDRIAMGANMPPEEKTPFDLIVEQIDDLYGEARNFASDGFKIASQEQADEIDKLDKALLKAQQDADELREAEKKPHDDAAKAVQAKFNPYVQKDKGKTYIARASLKALLTAWRVEQQHIANEKAKAAREAAEAERKAAEEALRASSGDLVAREQAEQMLDSAKQAEKVASKATKAATTGTGLKPKWVATMTDQRAAVAAMWKQNPQAFLDLAQTLAEQAVRAGARKIDGFEIKEEKVAI